MNVHPLSPPLDLSLAATLLVALALFFHQDAPGPGRSDSHCRVEDNGPTASHWLCSHVPFRTCTPRLDHTHRHDHVPWLPGAR